MESQNSKRLERARQIAKESIREKYFVMIETSYADSLSVLRKVTNNGSFSDEAECALIYHSLKYGDNVYPFILLKEYCDRGLH